jgi:hypothetical protein
MIYRKTKQSYKPSSWVGLQVFLSLVMDSWTMVMLQDMHAFDNCVLKVVRLITI